MAKLKPVAFAYDRAQDATYLYATAGKRRLLLRVEADLGLTLIREIPALSESLWVTDGVAVFWKIDTSVIVPLVPNARTKSLNGKLERRALASATGGLYSVAEPDHQVVRFTGSEWATCGADTPDGYMLRGDLGGAWQRTLRPGAWQPIVEQPKTPVHTSLAISGDRRHWLVAASSGTYLCEVGAATPRKTAAGWGWCAIGLGDYFYTSRNHKVWSIDLDGVERDCGIGADDPPDNALFACGERAFYLTGTTTVHVLSGGEWTKHDFGAASEGLGV